MSEFLVLNRSSHEEIDTVFGYAGMSVQEVKESLDNHDGYDYDIYVINIDECAELESINIDVVLNTEELYLRAIDAGYIDEDTLEVLY